MLFGFLLLAREGMAHHRTANRVSVRPNGGLPSRSSGRHEARLRAKRFGGAAFARIRARRYGVPKGAEHSLHRGERLRPGRIAERRPDRLRVRHQPTYLRELVAREEAEGIAPAVVEAERQAVRAAIAERDVRRFAREGVAAETLARRLRPPRPHRVLLERPRHVARAAFIDASPRE